MLRREEFEKELTQKGFYERWEKKSRSELRRLLDENVAEMVDFSQSNPHHCYDLYHHTLKTVEYLANGMKMEDHQALLAAAFFHDIGKTKVAKWKNGKKVFYGHPMRSALLADPILYKLGYSQKEREHICFYIANHDDFISFILPEESQTYPDRPVICEKSVRIMIQKLRLKYPAFSEEEWKTLWKHLPYLMYADLCAQAETVIWHGELIDSRQHKQQKILLVMNCIRNLWEENGTDRADEGGRRYEA